MAKKKDEGIKVINENGVLRVEDGDRFVEGNAKLSLGLKKKIQNMQKPSKMKVDEAGNEKSPVTMFFDDDYKANEDVDLYILYKRLTDWSKKKKITWENLLDDEDMVDLSEEFVKEFKEIHGLVKVKGDDEKKPE